MRLSTLQKRFIWAEVFILVGAFFITNQILDWTEFSRDLSRNPDPFTPHFSLENSEGSFFAFAKGWPTFLFFLLFFLGQGLIWKFREKIFTPEQRIDK